MRSRWSEREATEFISRYAERWGEDLALRTYTSRLIGADEDLVLHGGGNTSVKTSFKNALGENVNAVFVKASGVNLANAEPGDHVALDLEYLRRMETLTGLSDTEMLEEILVHRLVSGSRLPSIEALLHAFIPREYIDHTHADSVLALTNRPDGDSVTAEALGEEVITLDYMKPGLALARAAADAYQSSPEAEGMVLMRHGLVTWGGSARESYERTISLVERAEEWLRSKRPAVRKDVGAKTGAQPRSEVDAGSEAGPDVRKGAEAGAESGAQAAAASGHGRGAERPTPLKLALGRYIELAPLLRGALALPSGDDDRPYLRFILRPLITEEVLAIVDSDRGREICLTPPLTSDHLIRTKPFPLWIESPGYGSAEKAAARIPAAIVDYAKNYDDYFRRNAERMEPGLRRLDSMPRVILMPGVGAVCAGASALEADVVRDITEHTLKTKAAVFETGSYQGLDEGHLFDMEYFGPQHRKLDLGAGPPLGRTVALITGAAGAIGAGISEELLRAGCHVALTDLPGDALESYAEELRDKYRARVLGTPMDVTDRKSVSAAFDSVIGEWGGVDLVVVNAGVAHVSPIAEMNPDDFRRAERVNVEGALHVLAEAGVHFKLQGTGGDIVIISTKNVFAPGAEFGAYSATKAAAHQLGRIASQEMAPLGVRVNMVSPDAVFSHGGRKSGLWAQVGPGRMRARGLDEKGLEEYYVNRNLLKAKVTASHVAKAVIFFATRQTPTTGATIPVDGGLPDSTPR